jgi:hypothetical protein
MAATKSRSSRSTARKGSSKKAAATGSRKASTSKKAATRKKTSTVRSTKRGTGKRDAVNAPNATFYARRGSGGEFREMDEKGRSLAADRRQRAKATVVSGMGDRGDRRTKKR